MIRPEDFFDPKNDIFDILFRDAEYVWEGLANIRKCVEEILTPNISGIRRNGSAVLEDTRLDNGALIHAGAFLEGGDIEIGAEAVVEPCAYIRGPALIGPGTEVRHGAYIRGNVLTGSGCVVGHTTEMKNSVMLHESKAGHFAYIGDSILGSVNLGAGTKLANLKLVPSPVVLDIGDRKYETGLKKFGAIMADGVQTGCNSVTAPGTLLSRGTVIYPNTSARGFYEAETVVKLRQNTESKKKEGVKDL